MRLSMWFCSAVALCTLLSISARAQETDPEPVEVIVLDEGEAPPAFQSSQTPTRYQERPPIRYNPQQQQQMASSPQYALTRPNTRPQVVGMVLGGLVIVGAIVALWAASSGGIAELLIFGATGGVLLGLGSGMLIAGGIHFGVKRREQRRFDLVNSRVVWLPSLGLRF